MYKTIAEFTQDWKEESERTEKVLGALTDASLPRAVSKDDRTLGRIAWHVVTTIPEMLGHTGLKITAVDEHTPVPATAAEIATAYSSAARELETLVQSAWNDETLKVEDDMYGMKWPRGLTLQLLLRHEIHHRAQMTVLMRQAGLKVPGVYGPAREEWAPSGMSPPGI